MPVWYGLILISTYIERTGIQMPDNKKKDHRIVCKPVSIVTVPVGDPIDCAPGDLIHKVATWEVGFQGNSASGMFIEEPALTTCGLRTSRLRQNYPTSGEPCPECWSDGICCRIDSKRIRLVGDNSRYTEEIPF